MFVSDTLQISVYYKIVMFKIKAVHFSRQRLESTVLLLILEAFIRELLWQTKGVI